MAQSPTVDTTTMNMEASGRIYKSLPEGCIRVVRIQPGLEADDIVCRLEQPKLLSDSPSYEALSYAWGTCDATEYIYLGNERLEKFSVSPSLALALRMLRGTEAEVTMWIDAICINQANNAERAEQVKLMGEIYRSAERVVAFLGAHEDGSQELFQFLKDWKGEIDISRFDDAWQAGAAERPLLSRSYWQRAWIVQELVLASHKYLQCGKDRISFSALESFHAGMVCEPIERTIPITHPSRHVVDAGYSNTWHSRFDQLISTDPSISIDSFLNGFLESQCKDPRDHIYAFYNLLPRELKRHININYDTGAVEVICQAVQAMMTATRSLKIITLRSRQTSPEQEWQDSLPSWCPFLGVPYMDPPRSSGDLRVDNPTFSFSRDGKFLHVKGIVHGKICDRLPRFPPANRPFEPLKAKHVARLFYERNYAYECIQFMKESGLCGDVDLNERVLGKALDARPGDNLISYLERTKGRRRPRFSGSQIAQMSNFSQSFHGMQLCMFVVDAPSTRHDEEEVTIWVDFAIVPRAARNGDRICAIQGCEQLVVLRNVCQGRRFYRVIGEARVCSNTGDQIISQAPVSSLKTFTLI
ncbi:hypothetical protein ASPVEDRAFT_79633 [Aspergillus versicolor CBS 583.65]|uniref:Heterokaryon incompatibility domain-containing protein n=1 Tax=Aspergillus versicolor CBS 583.65 TaxID=1036611 RepID=A0A1L9P8W8_ASPVE|nr:uncharacterized protein ASPVEDRAFT_79633 [Aspergillus versicolor CBS 583.65]OJI97961.1 hypothetical protein ASPVEDRAFT_79633 [Aspergillus versicolor CBS 583.65]